MNQNPPFKLRQYFGILGYLYRLSFYGKNEYVASLGLTVEAITELVLGYGLPKRRTSMA